MQPKVTVIGTLDTKGEAVAHLKDRLEDCGCLVRVMDVGIRGLPFGHSDVSREDVARAGGKELDKLSALGAKAQAIEVMSSGARSIVADLYASGDLNVVIAVGGAQGAAIASCALQVLPLGVPKLLVTTVASGRNVFEPLVGTSDVTLMHSVADILGLDPISRRILDNAAAAISAMARESKPVLRGVLPWISMTMLGLTTPGVMRTRDLLLGQGYDVVPFHANGAGGRCMERLIDEGMVDGVIDFSTQELIGHLYHGLFDGGSHRMESAVRAAVPHVVVPGGTDYIVRGPMRDLPPEELSRPFSVHNANITLVRTTADQMVELGECIAERLNRATAPTFVVIPLGGFSELATKGGPFYDPEADEALIGALKKRLNSRTDLLIVDEHVNAPGFSEVVADTLTGALGP